MPHLLKLAQHYKRIIQVHAQINHIFLPLLASQSQKVHIKISHKCKHNTQGRKNKKISFISKQESLCIINHKTTRIMKNRKYKEMRGKIKNKVQTMSQRDERLTIIGSKEVLGRIAKGKIKGHPNVGLPQYPTSLRQSQRMPSALHSLPCASS